MATLVITDDNIINGTFVVPGGDIYYLICADCLTLTDIPFIQGLQRIYCDNCPLLQVIPNIPTLTYIVCWNCNLLVFIPNLENVTLLVVENCPLLRNIPYLPKLFVLSSNAPIFIESKIHGINSYGRWIKEVQKIMGFVGQRQVRRDKDALPTELIRNLKGYLYFSGNVGGKKSKRKIKK